MKVVFRSPRLALVRTDSAAADTGLPVQVIASVQKKLGFLEAAKDERDLRNWKSLNYEKLKGDRDGQRSIRVNKQWRIVFALDETSFPPTIEIIDFEDYH
jgi:proteic killer suppression protein